ncbi:hypothetical protein PI125_g14193 [Phytophthora idaei]|nr:hypothetical protein PI125_g14193 [Phytophthora idaei]
MTFYSMFRQSRACLRHVLIRAQGQHSMAVNDPG